MKCFTLYSNGSHRWLAFGQDPERQNGVVDTNQVVICSSQGVILLDPGGMEIFPAMMAALVHEIDMEQVRHIFLSHQDPDVGSALSLWRQVAPAGTSIHVPALWEHYIAHFDADAKLTPIPDEGAELALGPKVTLRFLPAHYLHSSAAFCVYDPEARVLFSGDIGAGMPGAGEKDFWCRDFASYSASLAGFHRRYLGSAQARDAWIEMVSRLKVDALIPQHGLGLRGEDVQRFLDWFAALPIASGLEAYRGRFAQGTGRG
jgi:flavorubredoxin